MFADYPQSRDIPALRQLWQEAFQDEDAFLDKFFSTGYHPNRCLVMMKDGLAAAALYWFNCQWEDKKLAYLYAVATAKAFQGQGLCRSLMAATHQLLRELGYVGTILVPGNESLRMMYEKMGYRTATTIREISGTAGQIPYPVAEISGAEYAMLRKEMLPADGVIQDGASLDFLATYAAFYKGCDCLLCARKEGEQLLCLELLGDESHIPGILRFFNCKTGTFRAPGTGKAFAMFCSFTDDTSAPAYLGHAFD